MKEFDLKPIWNSDRGKAAEHYGSLEDIHRLAGKRSDNILNKLRRNIIMELIASVIILLLLAVAVYQWDSGLPFWIFAITFAVIGWLSFRLYVRFLRQLREVNQKSILEALREYVRLVGKYIRRMKVLIYYLTPLGYLVGLAVGTFAGHEGTFTLQDFLVMGFGAIIGLPFLFVVIWFSTRKYIRWLYGKHYESLKEVLNSLEEQGGQANHKSANGINEG
jgi:hypothetical protein